jgi:hypothetical protein
MLGQKGSNLWRSLNAACHPPAALHL